MSVRRTDLLQDVFRRVSFGPPVESLEPRTQHHAGASGDFLKTVHGNADEMLRSITRGRVAVHSKEMRGINHGRKHITVLGHFRNVLAGMAQVYLPLPRHDAKHVE